MSDAQHSSTTDSAASRVFAVAELLEHILLQLRPSLDAKSRDDGNPDSVNGSKTPSGRNKTTKGKHWSDGIEDLFIVQRVCQQWNVVIRGSVNIQRAMLLEYADPNDATNDQKYGLEYLLDPDTAALKVHPALPCIQQLENNIGLNGKQQKMVRLRFSEHKISGGTIVVSPTGSIFGCNGNRMGEGSRCKGLGHVFNFATTRAYNPRKLGMNASWRRMKLFARPTQVQIHINIRAGFPAVYHRTIIMGDKLSHIGHVFDALESLATSSIDRHLKNGKACWTTMDEVWLGAEAWEAGARYDSPKVLKALIKKTEHEAPGVCQVSTGNCLYCSAVAELANLEADRRTLLRFFAEADPRMAAPKEEPVQKFDESNKENYDDSGFFEGEEDDF